MATATSAALNLDDEEIMASLHELIVAANAPNSQFANSSLGSKASRHGLRLAVFMELKPASGKLHRRILCLYHYKTYVVATHKTSNKPNKVTTVSLTLQRRLSLGFLSPNIQNETL